MEALGLKIIALGRAVDELAHGRLTRGIGRHFASLYLSLMDIQADMLCESLQLMIEKCFVGVELVDVPDQVPAGESESLVP